MSARRGWGSRADIRPWVLRAFLVAASALLVAGMAILPPVRKGDGCEYAQMTASFVNHRSPDARPGDLATLAPWCPDFRTDVLPYFEGASGRTYSYHFWGYSLMAVPAQLGLRALGGNELKAFQLTNALLLIAALAVIVCGLPWEPEQRLVLALLTLLSPAFWFVSWPHPEIYSYALVTMALVGMFRRAWTTSGALVALASWQNSPLILLVALIGARALRQAGPTCAALVLAVAGGIGAVPYVFSWLEFGTPSLLARHAAGLEHVTVQRLIEIFVDPNIGMLPYVPLMLPAFLAVVGYQLVARRDSTAVEFLVALLGLAIAAASTRNWNSDTAGPLRYAIWMLPLIFFAVVHAARARWGWLPRALLGSAILSQALIVVAGGFFTSRVDWLDHTRVAKFILREVPWLYNPSFELFTERTVHREGVDTFAVFLDRQRCRKTLVRPRDRDVLEALCGPLPAHVEAVLGGTAPSEPVYLNFPRDTPPAPAWAGEAATSAFSVDAWLSGAGRLAPGRSGPVAMLTLDPIVSGSSIRVGLRVSNVSTTSPCTIYVGAVLPDRRVATVRADGSFTIHDKFIGFFPSLETLYLDPCRALDLPALTGRISERDLPAGRYEVFVVVATGRPSPREPVRRADVLAADIKTFSPLR